MRVVVLCAAVIADVCLSLSARVSVFLCTPCIRNLAPVLHTRRLASSDLPDHIPGGLVAIRRAAQA